MRDELARSRGIGGLDNRKARFLWGGFALAVLVAVALLIYWFWPLPWWIYAAIVAVFVLLRLSERERLIEQRHKEVIAYISKLDYRMRAIEAALRLPVNPALPKEQ